MKMNKIFKNLIIFFSMIFLPNIETEGASDPLKFFKLRIRIFSMGGGG